LPCSPIRWRAEFKDFLDDMIRKPLPLLAGAILLAMPAAAAAPPFDTAATTAYMVDLSSGAILYAKDADRRMPPASMAKMMTTHVAFDLIRRGALDPNKICTVRPDTWRQWHGTAAGSLMFLSPGEQVSVANLLRGIVTLSGNDATVVLAECISGTEPAFVALMNRQSQAMGLANSHWGNPVGWPDGGATYTTARDLATLAAATIHDYPQLYREFYGLRNFTWGHTLGTNQPITQDNRNPLLGRVAGADGLKTGHTDEAGYGFTGSAEQNGRRIVMVVAGLGSVNQRIEESVRFMDWGFAAWQSRPLLRQGQHIGAAQVQGASVGRVGLVAPQTIAVTFPTGMGQGLTARIVYQGPVHAPIALGQHIADLVVTTEGMPPATMPLVAEAAVGEAGFFGRMWYGLKSLIGLG
jgi:D-alanyl-D-alanine carboxypeptidase (penicillin-binding protein 5/6)